MLSLLSARTEQTGMQGTDDSGSVPVKEHLRQTVSSGWRGSVGRPEPDRLAV